MPANGGCLRDDDFREIRSDISDLKVGQGEMKVRVDNIEKTQERRETKQNITLAAVLTTLGAILAHLFFRLG